MSLVHEWLSPAPGGRLEILSSSNSASSSRISIDHYTSHTLIQNRGHLVNHGCDDHSKSEYVIYLESRRCIDSLTLPDVVTAVAAAPSKQSPEQMLSSWQVVGIVAGILALMVGIPPAILAVVKLKKKVRSRYLPPKSS